MQASTLTIAQVTLITTIRNHTHLHGYPPTITELSQLTGRSRRSIVEAIHRLERRGIMTHRPYSPRSWQITLASA